MTTLEYAPANQKLAGDEVPRLVKPVNIEQLVQVVHQALDRQRSLLADRQLLKQTQERNRALEAREAELSEQVRRLEQELASLRAAGQ